MKRLSDIAGELRDTVAALDAERFDGRDAARLTLVGAEIERLGAAVKLLFATRAAKTGGWANQSQAVRAEQWLAQVSGTSEHQARQMLDTGDRLADCAATEAKLRDGSLSLAQAHQVTSAAAADPHAETQLLATAESGEFRRLTRERERVVAAATDERRAHQRAVKERHLRTWTEGVATHGSFSGPTEQVERVLVALAPFERQAFDQARTSERREPHAAYAFDGLIAMADATRTGTAGIQQSTKDVVRFRVDLDAFLVGETNAGEVCEIPGVGPVPVAAAHAALPHGLLELVITDGIDVQAVVSTTRHVPEALKIAIAERDPACKVRGCDRTDHLERHHLHDIAKGGATTYANLGNTCPDHHDLITHKGYRVTQHHDGSWTLRAPPHTQAAA